MIEAKDIIRAIRFKADDNNETKFSDYDIINAINEVLDLMNNSLALLNSDFLEKKKVYETQDADEVEKGFRLPYDFVTLVGITENKHGLKLRPCSVEDKPRWHQYKIIGEKIYTKVLSFTIYYRCRIEDITSEKDTIMLPMAFKRPIVNLSLLVLTKAKTELQDAVNDAVANIVPRRRYVNARIKMPFYR